MSAYAALLSWTMVASFYFFFPLLKNIKDFHIHSRPASSEVLHKINDFSYKFYPKAGRQLNISHSHASGALVSF